MDISFALVVCTLIVSLTAIYIVRYLAPPRYRIKTGDIEVNAMTNDDLMNAYTKVVGIDAELKK